MNEEELMRMVRAAHFGELAMSWMWENWSDQDFEHGIYELADMAAACGLVEQTVRDPGEFQKVEDFEQAAWEIAKEKGVN